MSLQEVISILQSRISNLQTLRSYAVSIGDIIQIEKIDADISETQMTLNKLTSLS